MAYCLGVATVRCNHLLSSSFFASWLLVVIKHRCGRRIVMPNDYVNYFIVTILNLITIRLIMSLDMIRDIEVKLLITEKGKPKSARSAIYIKKI